MVHGFTHKSFVCDDDKEIRTYPGQFGINNETNFCFSSPIVSINEKN